MIVVAVVLGNGNGCDAKDSSDKGDGNGGGDSGGGSNGKGEGGVSERFLYEDKILVVMLTVMVMVVANVIEVSSGIASDGGTDGNFCSNAIGGTSDCGSDRGGSERW